MRMWQNHKKTLRAIILFFGISTALLVVLSFLAMEVYQKEKEISLAKQEISIFSNKTRLASRARDRLEKASLQIALLETTFVREETFVDVIANLERIAKNSGVVLEIRDADVRSSSDRAGIAMFVNGSFSQ